MVHRHYYEIEAESEYEAGYLIGKLFRRELLVLVADLKSSSRWKRKVKAAQTLADRSRNFCPHYLDELKGMADGAALSSKSLLAICFEQEVQETPLEKCTTIVTNGGTLIGHSEDWRQDAANWIVLLRKRVRDQTVFHLYYLGSLGGNALSVNSRGWVHAVNSLLQNDCQPGIPRDIIARFFADGDEKSIEALPHITRTSGYHHTLVGSRVLSLETTATRFAVTEPQIPFVHTNHYLSASLAVDFPYADAPNSQARWSRAHALVEAEMTDADMMRLLEDDKPTPDSIRNNRTLASVVVNLRSRKIHVWLRRENSLGWISYPLAFIDERTPSDRT